MTQDISIAEQAYNAAREGQDRGTLLWLQPRDLSDGSIVPVGFWDGEDHREFVIDGETRLYFGAGAALGFDDIEGGVGLDVRYTGVRLGLVPEVETAVRGFDIKLAPAEIHTVAFSLQTGNPLADPRRIFKGQVNECDIPKPEEGGTLEISLRLASAARALTRTLPLYRSDAALRRRNPTDRGREYVSTVGIKQIPWGEESIRG